eukprot:g32918.t1
MLPDRTCGKLSNHHHIQAKTEVNPTSVIKLQYADDACVCVISEDVLQTIIGIFTELCESIDLTLNIRINLALWSKPPVIKADIPSIVALTTLDRLQWVGHVARMIDPRFPNQDGPHLPDKTEKGVELQQELFACRLQCFNGDTVCSNSLPFLFPVRLLFYTQKCQVLPAYWFLDLLIIVIKP